VSTPRPLEPLPDLDADAARAGSAGAVAWVRGEWRLLAPVGIAISSLLALVAVLFVLQGESEHVRGEVARLAEPARAELNRFQTGLALEMSAQRGFLISGDAAFVQDERDGRDEEAAVDAVLDTLVRPLGRKPSASLDTLRRLTARWRESPWDPASLRGLPPAEVDRRLVARQDLFEEVLAAGTRLDHAIVEAEKRRWERIARLDSVRIAVAVGLVALALASVAGLVRLAARLRALGEQSRALAAEAERRRRALEEVAEEKARFLRGITHDLKNPLGAIDAYAQLLEGGVRGDLTPDQLVFVGRIRRVTQECLGIIHDLLHLARAEARQLRIERQRTDLVQLVHETADDYRAAAQASGFALELDLPDDVEPVHTDGRRVREILGNLLSNALKHTPPGGRIGVCLVERRDGPGVALEVTDSGPGIPPQDRERIFGEFQRLSPGAVHGSGIGLAISRQIARLLGGDLTVGGEPGGGAVFTLWLPRGALASESPASFPLVGR
jgi:signal transduction histidine kinase